MGFEKGSLSFRMFFTQRDFVDEDINKFAAAAFPPLNSLAEEEEIHGWVASRHMLDRNITEDTAYLGGYLRLTLTQAKKKVPASLLAAECAIEEMKEETGLEGEIIEFLGFYPDFSPIYEKVISFFGSPEIIL